jgi:rhodanese-related sulfurtransferase
MKKIIYSTFTLVLLSVNTLAYDNTKAEELSSFYSHMTQNACADSKLFIPAEDVLKMLREKKAVTLLDVRTEAEAKIIAVSEKDALHFPIAHLFEKKNLDILPKSEPIVVICHSGTRATLAAIGLKRIGFKHVHVLKGGLVSLAIDTNPKNAPVLSKKDI